MLFKKKTKPVQKLEYDSNTKKPVLKCSICNGEQVAGLKDIKTGHFEEIMLVKNDCDLEQFKEMAGVNEVPREY